MTDAGQDAFRLDRALQRRILERLREHYPERAIILGEVSAPDDAVVANLSYLEEHGLCESGLSWGLDGSCVVTPARITARGLDFLEDDGGLSAILGTVTIRIEAETLRNLLSARVDESDLPAAEKSRIKAHLAALSEAALKSATAELTKLGLAHLPNAIQWLRTLAGLG